MSGVTVDDLLDAYLSRLRNPQRYVDLERRCTGPDALAVVHVAQALDHYRRLTDDERAIFDRRINGGAA